LLQSTTQGVISAKQRHFLMPPHAWRPGLEPAELSFRVPHFFHQTRKGSRGAMILMTLISLEAKKIADLNRNMHGMFKFKEYPG
jgi:hypothetical protein